MSSKNKFDANSWDSEYNEVTEKIKYEDDIDEAENMYEQDDVYTDGGALEEFRGIEEKSDKDDDDKKKKIIKIILISVLSVVFLAGLIALGVYLYNYFNPVGEFDEVGQNDVTDMESNYEENYVETTDLHNVDSTNSPEEDLEPNDTEELNKDDALSKEETSTIQGANPSAKKNKYKLIYNEVGQISEVEIRIYGNYNPAKIKSGDTIELSINTDRIEVGTDEQKGKFKGQYNEGYDWDFNLVTKKGCLESYSCAGIEFEDGSFVNADGFPERQEPYSNAVKMDFTDEYVIVSLLLDKPVDIEEKNIQVFMSVDEKTFTTYEGVYNEYWEKDYSKEVPQPDIDLTPSMMQPIEE